MCGISGIARITNRETCVDKVRTMNRLIAHRGPDAEGIWSNNFCVLGHRRLSIIDTSEAGNQPFHSTDKKLVVVFNGEIYNYLELKKELEATHTFTTQTDTEVIIAAYNTWGVDCVQHFFGMFAFALWDEEQQHVFIARDRLGVKPLYYAETENGIVFASEIRAILSTEWLERRISSNALADYLRYQTVHAPNTIIEGVHMLMPGHRILINQKGFHTERWWDLVDNRVKLDGAENITSVHKRINELLTSSIELRMRADVPFGAFLSGGIDSSIVVGLMSRISQHPVNTFSITFQEQAYDESPYSELIAKRFNTKHHAIQLSADHFLKTVPEALMAMDHPSGDGPNTYVVSKATRAAGVKMALSGLGGDEVFAGYDVFRRMKALETKDWLNRMPLQVRKNVGVLLRAVKPSAATEKLAAALAQERIDLAHFYPLTRQVLYDTEVKQLLRSMPFESNCVQLLAQAVSGVRMPTLSKVSVLEISTYMQNVLLRDADQMSMAHALEIRVPFLDHRLIEFVLGVSDRQKFPHTPKELLTASVGDLIPREIIDRPKMGFTFPWALWMKSELKPFCEEQLKALERIEALRYDEVMHLWKRFQAGDKRITWSRIWPLVVLGHWVKQHDAH
jgi:asparagine synthase (glutamine-hydrolysing)